jgi:hypothetical protein
LPSMISAMGAAAYPGAMPARYRRFSGA